MKVIFSVILFFTVQCLLFSQIIIFPPELKWWLVETQKANPDIKLEKFKLEYEKITKIEDSKIITSDLYPIFMKWNYSGNKCAYMNIGADLTKEKDGKYSLDFDIDSAVYIIDKRNIVIFQDWFGSSEGIDSIEWLTDNILISVGTEYESVGSEIYTVSLIINIYEIQNKTIKTKKYVYKKAFDSIEKVGLKLNWYEQRDDYFELRKN